VLEAPAALPVLVEDQAQPTLDPSKTEPEALALLRAPAVVQAQRTLDLLSKIEPEALAALPVLVEDQDRPTLDP